MATMWGHPSELSVFYDDIPLRQRAALVAIPGLESGTNVATISPHADEPTRVPPLSKECCFFMLLSQK